MTHMPHSSLARVVAAVLGVVIGVFVLAGCATAQAATDPSLGAKALQNLSPFEKHALKDKHVTQAEFDESMKVYTECFTTAGLKYTINPDQVGMGSVLVYDADDDAMQRCGEKVNAVQNVWVLEHHTSAADLVTMQATLVSCFRDAGLTIKPGATFADAERAKAQFMDSLPEQYNNNSAQGQKAYRVSMCQQNYQKVSGAQPLPGLKEALEKLDTSGW